MKNPEALVKDALGELPPAMNAAAHEGLFDLFALYERMPGLAMITGMDGALLSINAAGRSMLGLGRTASLAGESILARYSAQSRELVRNCSIPAAIRNGVWCGETTLIDRLGQPIPLWQVTAFHRNAGSQGGLISTLAWDFSSQKDLERNLWHQATHDALTGLPNRALLMDRLMQAIHGAQRTPHFTAVLLMDVDGFKAINDDCGHETGNQILTELAVRMYSCLRACDTVGRYGGDEFVFLLCELKEPGEVGQAMRRIWAALESPFLVGNRSFRVGASIGVAIHPDHGNDAESLLNHADMTMYRAKARNRSQRHEGSPASLERIGPTVSYDNALSA
ncbi:MAG: diguanylate cyclase domain-containing protein [Steroidobacteraceae bacterium]